MTREAKDTPAHPQSPPETTLGALLGGRLAYRQFRDGYRTGIEPVLLAAAIPAAPGERVLEAGCGAGAGLLCLSARIQPLEAAGIEADPATASLARQNLDANGHQATLLHQACLPALPAGIGRFDHVFANPPWHRACASASPVSRRDLARRATAGLLDGWIRALASILRPGGTLTLILPAARHAEASASFVGSGFGGIALLPCWPKHSLAARIILMQARLGARTDASVLPGLVLHRNDGSYTDPAEAILRHGAALDMRPCAYRAARRFTD